MLKTIHAIYFLSVQWLCLLIDMMKLRQAKEENVRLDAENRALRERIRTIGSEKKDLLHQVHV